MHFFSQEAHLTLQSIETTNSSKPQKNVDMSKIRKLSADEIKSHLAENFIYPVYLKENAIGGIVKMKVDIGTTGQIN